MPKLILTQLNLSQAPLAAPTNARAQAWEVVGCMMILACVGGAGGLWAWNFTEFLRLLMETILWPLQP